MTEPLYRNYAGARTIILGFLRSTRRLPAWRWRQPEHRDNNIRYGQRQLVELRRLRAANIAERSAL